jgi:hypothetical protein
LQKCGAKLLLFLHLTKYFCYFCIQIWKYEAKEILSSPWFALVSAGMRDDCRWLPNRNEQPQLVSATQPAGSGGRHGAVCGQEEKRQQVLDAGVIEVIEVIEVIGVEGELKRS